LPAHFGWWSVPGGDIVIFEIMYSKNKPDAPTPKELREKKSVTHQQGRMEIFYGYHWPTATQPRKGVRFVINTDTVQNPQGCCVVCFSPFPAVP